MGYDLHVIRSRKWFDSAKNPITREEVDVVVANDPELRWADTATFVGGEPESTFVLRGLFIEWLGEPWFHMFEGVIVGGSRNEAAIFKLAEIAEKLSARLVGDDGEEYRIKRTFFGRRKLQTLPAPND